MLGAKLNAPQNFRNVPAYKNAACFLTIWVMGSVEKEGREHQRQLENE